MQSRLSALILGDLEDPRKRLAALFGGEVPSTGQPPAPALAWALARLRSTEGRAITTRAAAVRFLRSAEPRLPLKPAVFLVRHAMPRR